MTNYEALMSKNLIEFYNNLKKMEEKGVEKVSIRKIHNYLKENKEYNSFSYVTTYKNIKKLQDANLLDKNYNLIK